VGELSDHHDFMNITVCVLSIQPVCMLLLPVYHPTSPVLFISNYFHLFISGTTNRRMWYHTKFLRNIYCIYGVMH